MTAHRLRGLALPLVLLVTASAFQGCSMVPRPGPSSSGGGGGAATLEVVNRSSEPIFWLYASSCSNSNWGDDRLGTDTISAGETMSFQLTSGCWDFKAKYEGGTELVQRNVQIGNGSSYTWTVG